MKRIAAKKLDTQLKQLQLNLLQRVPMLKLKNQGVPVLLKSIAICTMFMSLTSISFADIRPKDGGESGGGGHNITKCDGKNLMLDEYDVKSEIKLIAKDDPRFASARIDMKKTIAEIATKYPLFAEDLAATERNIEWRETCQPLANISDYVSMGEINPIISQAAIQNKYGDVLVSTQALESYNKDAIKSLKYLYYHETFKALFGQQVDRQTLKEVVNLTVNDNIDFDRFVPAINSINRHLLIGDLELKVVCANCTEKNKQDIFWDRSNGLAITLNFHGKRKIITSDNFEVSFIIDRSSGDYGPFIDATLQVFGNNVLAGPMILKFYSNGKLIDTIGNVGFHRDQTFLLITRVPTR